MFKCVPASTSGSSMSDDEDTSFISKVVPVLSSIIPRPSGILNTIRPKKLQSVPEDEPAEVAIEQAPEDLPESLEGTLFHRKGRSAMSSWKRRYVVFHLTDGGSLSCYRFTSKKHYPTRIIRKMYTRLHRRDSTIGSNKDDRSHQELCLHIPSDVPWVAKDIENDPASFVVEIPLAYQNSSTLKGMGILENDFENTDDDSLAISFASPMTHSMIDDQSSIGSPWSNDREIQGLPNSLEKDLASAKGKNKPLRFYFNCPRKGNEKALWLRAFSEMGRLSSHSSKKRKIFGSLKHMARVSRIRTPASADFSRESLQLEGEYRQTPPVGMVSTRHLESHSEVEELVQPNLNERPKEYLVQPNYAYPHRWMSHQELRDEMILPSSQFHDLRLPSRSDSEIGNLRVEVLQCLGLPKHDKATESDASVYCVCGSYAFATDVIPSCTNPMWLCKMRRACIFPLFHAYARLYVGVFDEAGKREKDDFVGRIALDLSRLRPGCTYDVTFPLRLSTHVYSRRQRGAIRLRFHLEWSNERKALLSYLPKRIRLPSRQPPTDHVTVECSSPKAFRNVATTVHGSHVPGKFSTNQLRAAIKEFNFTRIFVMRTLRQTAKNTVFWKTPAISMFVFFAWMHCIYRNAFSLVPAYVLSFLLLHLVRNYARYEINGPGNRAFLPPTWEELFLALIDGSPDRGSQCIAPLDMHLRHSSLSRVPSPMSLSSQQDNLFVQTHEPWGRKEFKLLGFLDGDDSFDSMANHDNHMEFPFATGDDYPRFTVKDALSTRTPIAKRTKERPDEKGSRDNSETVEASEGASSEFSSVDGLRASRDDDELEFIPDDDSGPSPIAKMTELGYRSGSALSDSRSSGAPPGREMLEMTSFDASEDNVPARKPDESLPIRPMPEQNIDVRVQNTEGTTLTEELQEIKEKMHELTFHLFNDKAFVVKNPEKVWGKPRRSEKKKGSYDANRDLEKILNVGQYSHSNPVIARIGLYIEPIVAASMGFICLFRSLFNIATWQDPFLSFWTSLGCAVAIAILFVFPWRLFMFFAGIICVGPQNWLLRVYRERKKRKKADGAEDLNNQNAHRKSLSEQDSLDQPVFHGHSPANSASESVTHHVVVPYSPLMYQRFYDWPPEAQYARVKSDPTSSSVLQGRRRKNGSLLLQQSFSPPLHTKPTQSALLASLGSPGRKRKGHKRFGSHTSEISRNSGKGNPDRFASGYHVGSTSAHDSTTLSKDMETWMQNQNHEKEQ